LSRLVHFTRASATAVAASVSGAPRATLASVAVATLVFASLLPQLSLVNNEEMWLPEGPRTDSYHALASTLGSTEYVGVLARVSDGNIVTASQFEALLALEDAAVADPSVAEAFRFPRDPDANALSIADLVAEADAVLGHRRDIFDPLAGALVATVNASAPAAVSQAVGEARAAVVLLSVIRDLDSRGPYAHALPDRLLPELEVALLSGTGPSYKSDAAALLLAAADFANWSSANAPLNPADPALAAARALVVAASVHLLSNASAPTKAAAISLISNALLQSRSMLDLDGANASGASLLLFDIAAAFEGGGGSDGTAAYANVTAALARASLALDRLDPVGDAEAARGVALLAFELGAILGANVSSDARSGSASIAARLFEAFVAMGDHGLDLAVPQTNVSYESYSVSINENATVLGPGNATHAERLRAAEDMALRTTAFLGNLINLNLTGIFTDQESFQRVLTMVTFLNDTFAQLHAVLALPDSPAILDHAAAMVSDEVLLVLNTSAVPAHRFDLNTSAALSLALRGLQAAILAHGATPGAPAFERAAGLLFSASDFEAKGLLSGAREDVQRLATDSLESSSAVLSGGEPPGTKASFAALASAAFLLPSASHSSGLGGAAQRQLFAIIARESASLSALLQVGQNPALFARLTAATLGVFSDGLNSTQGAIEGTAPALVAPLRSLIEPVPAFLASATNSNASKDLFIAQVFVGASTAEAHLHFVPGPDLPRDRTQASQRIRALGDAGVASTLGVLLNTTASLPPQPASIAQGDLRFQPFVDAVASYSPGTEAALRQSFGFRARTLLPNALQATSGSIVAEGTVVLFLFNGSLDRSTLGARETQLRDLARARGGEGTTYTAFGYGLMWYDTQKAMDLSVVLFALTMLIVMGAALWAVYRNLFDVLLTVALLGFTVLWVLGSAALLGIAINPVTQVIPVLLIGLAEDYAVHITIGYRRKRASGAAPAKAVLAAVLGVGGVLFVATVTNGLSFLSFGGSNIALIRDFGTLMALGLAYSFLLTLTFIPAATTWRDRRFDARALRERGAAGATPASEPEAPEKPPSRTERALLRTVHTCVVHPGTTLLVVALLTAAAAIGATSLSTTFSYDQITARDLEVVRTLNAAQDGYGASIQRVFIVVDGAVDEPSVFLALDAASALARDDPYVTAAEGQAGVSSIVSFANDLALRMRLEGASAPGYTAEFSLAFGAADTDGSGRLDAGDNLTQPSIAAVYDALLNDPLSTSSEYIHRGASGFDRAAIRVEAQRAVEHGDALTAALESDAAPLRVSGLSASVSSVTVTGLPLLNREVMKSVQDSGWQSVLATVMSALIILTVFFWVAFRSLALGALTIAPTLIAVAWTLGAMVLFGMSLNMMTVMIATTTVGMGDLYAIHIAYSLHRELRLRKDPLDAADEMGREAGAPLLEASATTALGFLILVLAPVPVVQSYGLIFALSIVFAFLYSIIVMPVLVVLHARATHKVGVDVPEGAPPAT
jgi:uncharacterized protein